MVGVVLIAERISAKRQALSWLAEESFLNYGAPSRAPTIIRRTSVNTLPPTKKDAQRRHFVGGGGRS